MPAPPFPTLAPAFALPYGGPYAPERYPCGLRASCQPLAAWLDRDFIWPATISDLSTCGLGLVLGRRFEAGAALSVELPATAERCEETFLVKVTQVSALRGGQWLLGCAFVSELSEDTVLALVSQGETQQTADEIRLAAPAVEPPSSGRGALEKVVANVRFCAVGADGTRLWFTGRRVYPRLAWPLAGGASLIFRTGGAAEDAPGCRVVVERCRQEQGRWIVYCRLVGGSPADLLRQLRATG